MRACDLPAGASNGTSIVTVLPSLWRISNGSVLALPPSFLYSTANSIGSAMLKWVRVPASATVASSAAGAGEDRAESNPSTSAPMEMGRMRLPPLVGDPGILYSSNGLIHVGATRVGL